MTKYLTREEALSAPVESFAFKTMCKACGTTWGLHMGAACPTGVFSSFVPVEEEPVLIERIEPIDGPFFVYDGTPQEVAEAVQFLVGLREARNTTEPKRPALDWNKPTPFTTFDGYEVTRSTNEQQACKSPLTTLGDGTDPAHASAFLKF